MSSRLKVVSIIASILFALIIILYQSSLRASLSNNIKEKIAKDFTKQVNIGQIESEKESDIRFRFAAISDIHNNSEGLRDAINEINNSNNEFTIIYGDVSNTGTETEFTKIKAELDKLTRPYYILAGDHDLWNGRDKTEDAFTYFNQAFSKHPISFEYKGAKIIFVNNADIYKGIPEDEYAQTVSEIKEAQEETIIISSHKAIYHPLTIHRMGYINEDISEEPYRQAEELTEHILQKKQAKVYLLHGDLHASSTEKGPDENIINITVGALTKDKNFQTPRYAEIRVYKNGTLTRVDKEIK